MHLGPERHADAERAKEPRYLELLQSTAPQGVAKAAVIQAFAGSVIDTREGDASGNPPFQLDRCHALRRDGSVVAKHYPRWHLAPEPVSPRT